MLEREDCMHMQYLLLHHHQIHRRRHQQQHKLELLLLDQQKSMKKLHFPESVLTHIHLDLMLQEHRVSFITIFLYSNITKN